MNDISSHAIAKLRFANEEIIRLREVILKKNEEIRFLRDLQDKIVKDLNFYKEENLSLKHPKYT